MTCAACEDTIPCVNNYLTFGAYDDQDSMALITRIALTQVFPIATPLTIQLSLIMDLVSFCPGRKRTLFQCKWGNWMSYISRMLY